MESMKNNILENYFLVLFAFIPISIILGPAISLSNILLIDLSFIIFALNNKKIFFSKDYTVKIMLLLLVYLIFNSIISLDSSIGAFRNFGFIRFIILFMAFNYFFYDENFFNKVIFAWSIILLIVVFDVYVERFTGTNVLGFGAMYIDGIEQPNGKRVVSFFIDEPIVGSYINAFYLIIVGFLFSLSRIFSKKYKNIIFVISIFFILSILLTGERSNTIKAFSGFFIFYFLNDFFKLRKKIIFIFSLFILIGFFYNGSEFLKMRYTDQFINPILSLFESEGNKTEGNKTKVLNPNMHIKENLYFKLYHSGFSVFKKYPLFGVGNKNYRIEACSDKDLKYICNTHPHQTYVELLAEHGLIGGILLLSILFSLILKETKIIFKSKNYIQIGCLLYLLTPFIPLLPSGAFFSDFNITLFCVNLSLMYSVNKKTNIYSSK